MTADVIQGVVPFKEWFPAGYDFPVVWRVIGSIAIVMMFLYSFAKLYVHRQVFQNVRSLRQQKCSRGYRGLVLMPSPSNAKTFSMPDNDDCFMALNGIELKGKDLEEDIDKLNTDYLNWQHLLRCFLPHIHSLDAVFVIGSSDTERTDPKTGEKRQQNGSFKAIEDIRRIVQRYCSKDPQFRYFDKAVDFEDFTELQDAIVFGLELLNREFGIDEKDIIIDVTGGQKTTSIAGAAVTLNRHVAFQYVQTNPDYEVWEYDLALRNPVST